MANQKYYVVWIGRDTGVFETWHECKTATEGFRGARFRSYPTRSEAEEAYRDPSFGKNETSTSLAKGKRKVPKLSKRAKKENPPPMDLPKSGIAVDGACKVNPGAAEYRGVWIQNKQVIFASKTFQGSNNVAEFLAIVHAMALCLLNETTHIPIYSDSANAIKWVTTGKCKTKLPRTPEFAEAYGLIVRAEKWLAEHPLEIRPSVIKWQTSKWGEIPADYGRK